MVILLNKHTDDHLLAVWLISVKIYNKFSDLKF